MGFFSTGASFELLDNLCSLCPGTKDLLFLEAMTNDSCLLDLGVCCLQKDDPRLTGHACSLCLWWGVWRMCVRWSLWGPSQLPSKPTFLLSPSSKHKSPTFQMPSTNCPAEQRGWHLGSSPFCSKRLVSLPSGATVKNTKIILHGLKFLCQQTKQQQ